MKVNKLKKLIIFSFLLLITGIFCACGSKPPASAKFTQKSLVVAVDQEFEIDELVEFENCELSDLTFISSNLEVVFVKPNNVFVSRDPGVAVITIENFDNTTLEITVQGTEIKFPTPTNIVYNQSKGAVVWDVVYADGVVATNYEVTLTNSKGESTTELINKNSYKIDRADAYTIVVSAVRAGYVKSDPSPAYSFAKLNAPTSLVYSDVTKTLSWEADEFTTNFRVKLNKVYSETITTKYYSLDLSAPGEYEISVMSCAADGQEAFGAESQEVIKLIRLKTPEPVINQGKITWTDEGNHATYFKLDIDGPSPISTTIQNNGVGEYEYTLENLYPGEYGITITAMGDVEGRMYTRGTHYLNSDTSAQQMVTQLQVVDIAYDKATNKIYVPYFYAEDGNKLMLNVSLDGNVVEVADISLSGEYVPNITDAGVYKFTLVNASKNEQEISSATSDELQVVKLANASTARHSIVNGKYVIDNYNVANAQNYLIEIIYYNDGSESVVNYSSANNDVDELFSRVGTYGVRITASNTDTSNTFYITSTFLTDLQIVRPGNCELSNDSENETINWNRVLELNNLVYGYTITGAGSYEGVLSDNSYDYSGLGVGTYTISVWATTNATAGEQVIILDSKIKNEIEFSVYRTLATPSVVWTRDGDNYAINIKQVLNANRYDVYFNGSISGFVAVTDANKDDEYVAYNITNLVNGLGAGVNFDTYNFEVVARNTENIYYNNSVVASFKALRATAPTQFSLTSEEDILTSINQEWYSKNKILISADGAEEIEADNLNATGLAGGSEYVVKIKYVANAKLVDDSYYIDSYYTSFILQRREVTLTIENEKLKWETSPIATGFSETISISQAGDTQYITVTGQDYFDLLSLEYRNFNLVQNAVVGFKTTILGVNGETEGVYVNGNYVDNAKDMNELSPQTFYISSNNQNINVRYADAEIGIGVVEAGSVVTISWTSKATATYNIYGTNEFKLDSSVFTPNITNHFGLEEVMSNCRSVYLFDITRYENVVALSIDEDENVTVPNLPFGANLVKTINGSAVTNLQSVNDTATIVAYYDKTSLSDTAHSFMLTGNASEFNFKRLEPYSRTIRISSDKMYIEKEDDGTNDYRYLIKFYDTDNHSQVIEMEIATTFTNVIDLAEDFYHQIIDSLGAMKYYGIKKQASQTLAVAGQTYYLSSDYSTGERLKVLEAPVDLVFELLDNSYGQRYLQLDWSLSQENVNSGFQISGYNIRVTHDGFTTTTTSSAKIIVGASDPMFNSAGVWTVSVQAVGFGDTITSNYSSSITMVRLAEASALTITSTGLISWTPVENAVKYVLTYKDVNSNGSVINEVREINVATTKYQLTDAELAKVFEGELQVSLFAMGDGDHYFSSQKDASFIREMAPNIQVLSDHILFLGYNNYTMNASVSLVATIGSHEVISQVLNVTRDSYGNYTWYYPENYSYIENGKTVFVDFTTAKDITFTLMASNTSASYFNSNVVVKQATILANLTNPRFSRDASGDIHFYIDNPNLEQVATLTTIGGQVITDQTSTTDITITEARLGAMSSNWEIRAKATGGIVNDKVYIDGIYTVVTGTKLSTVRNVTTNDGVVVWDAVTNANDYRTFVDGSIKKTGYTLLKEQLAGQDYPAGVHTILVKALGNVGTTAISENVVLDGDYSDAHTITKLQQIANINVLKGFFTFDEIDNADAYMAIIYSNLNERPVGEFELTQFTFITDEAIEYYHNLELLALLAQGGEYYIKFYAKATTTDNVSSDCSDIEINNAVQDYLIIEQFTRVDNNITLIHPESNGVIDYTTTIAQFNQNSSISNGYIVSINDARYLKDSLNPSEVLDADGSWAPGNYAIKYVQLGSSGIPNTRKVYLTPDFGEALVVTKLDAPTPYNNKKPSEPYENFLSYTMVDDADTYYCYFGDQLYGTYVTAGVQIDPSGLDAKLYNSYGVKAVSTTNINLLASSKNYLTIGQDHDIVKIRKLNIPDQIMVEDGALYWSFNTDVLLQLASGHFVTSPFFSNAGFVSDETVMFKFTNTETGISYQYYDYLYKFVKITDDQISQVANVNASLANTLQALKRNGFPTLNFSFKDFANTLPVGEYNIQYRLIGNFDYFEGASDVLTLSSEYSVAIKKYVTAAPVIRIENNNDVFNLKFKNVTVNTNYYGGTKGYPTYVVVLTSVDENGLPQRTILTEVNANTINDSSTLTVNLTAFVENEVLTSIYTGIYVYVKGNDTYGILNGKCSNELPIIVLEPIVASVNRGVFEWVGQLSSTKYVVNYDNNTIFVTADQTINTYEWFCEQLIAGQAYTISMYAYGTAETKASDQGVTVVSGKLTQLGSITKLNPVAVDINAINIVNGIYTWQEVANSTGYDVFITKDVSSLGNYIALGNVLEYETEAEDNEINYYLFRAVGTILLRGLNENSSAYVNSEISPVNIGIRLPEIEDLKIVNGIVTWTSTVQDAWFRLVFNKTDSVDAETITRYVAYQDVAASGVCYFDTNNYEALSAPGLYSLKIQAYYPSKTQMGDDPGVYYVISSPVETETDIYKLNPVSDIKVESGIVSWSHDETARINYYYQLRFTYVNDYDQTIERILNIQHDISQNGGTCEAVVFEGNIQNKAITLYIMVIPGEIGEETESGYLRSIEVEYEADIYQFNTIDENTIRIDITQNGSLLIEWDAPIGGNPQDNFYYEVYYQTDTGLTGYVTTSNTSVICAPGQQIPIDIQVDNSYLYFKIRLVPPRNSTNQISSWWTELRKIEKPSVVTNFEYIALDYKFTWDRYQIQDIVQNSVYYKIKDEVGHYIGQDGAFVVDTAYVLDANLGDEVYTPFAVGVHRVSIAVIVRNSSGGDGLMSNYSDPVMCNYNLFESGIGTEFDPYIISTEEQFGNIKYRLNKDNKNNSYYAGSMVNGELVISEIKNVLGTINQIYHFKQADHLVITPENVLVYGLSSTYYEFNGNYDGDYYSLTLAWNEDIERNSTISYISLFERVGRNGVLQNINVKLDLTSQSTLEQISISKVLEVSVLAHENYGIIQNIAVGYNETEEFAVKIAENSFKLTFVVSGNYGEVINVENFYNVSIVNNGNMAAVEFAPFVLTNNTGSTISGAKNNGNIAVNAFTAHIAGVVEYASSQSRVEQASNIGNLYVFLRKNSTSNIGGIIAKNDGATITYCYVVADITVASGDNSLTNPIVGALIGDSTGDNISYSYTNVTKNGNVITGSVGYEGIYQVIGNLVTPTGCTAVFYKRQTGFNAVKSSSIVADNYTAYETTASNITDLFLENSGFQYGYLDESGNPRLRWENDYDLISWQQ